MTKPLNQTDGLSPSDVKVLSDIQTAGWHKVGVFALEHEQGPEWAYTIGLFHSYAHPEVILLGLPQARCMDIINVIGTQVKTGSHFESEHDYVDILQDPFRCVFKEVDRDHYRDYVGYAIWFYEHAPFPLLQCFWPDQQGRYPWDEGCNDFVKRSQPLLFIP